LSIRLFGIPLALGPGYNGLLEASRGELSAALLLALLALKILSTLATGASNGVGALFFPSAMMRSALGAAIGRFLDPASLFAVVGIASFLGSAYNVTLAGVTFVAETTGAPGYIIPGLLAAAVRLPRRRAPVTVGASARTRLATPHESSEAVVWDQSPSTMWSPHRSSMRRSLNNATEPTHATRNVATMT
jgi:Voltage gated chloride channel